MNIDDFEKLFEEGWWKVFKPFLESEEFETLWNEMKSRIERGKIIFPASSTLKKKYPKWIVENTIFRAFKETPFKDLKVVILGLSPYFTTNDGIPDADGLAFSTKSGKEPPSLSVLYNSIQNDVYAGQDYTMNRETNLKFLAEQGVLLLNSALTCEPNMPTVHVELWKPFMKYFFSILNEHFSDLHIVFMGEEAQKYRKYVQETSETTLNFANSHYVYSVGHPAYYARIGETMNTNIFSKINERLTNNKEKPIQWD